MLAFALQGVLIITDLHLIFSEPRLQDGGRQGPAMHSCNGDAGDQVLVVNGRSTLTWKEGQAEATEAVASTAGAGISNTDQLVVYKSKSPSDTREPPDHKPRLTNIIRFVYFFVLFLRPFFSIVLDVRSSPTTLHHHFHYSLVVVDFAIPIPVRMVFVVSGAVAGRRQGHLACSGTCFHFQVPSFGLCYP